jgi:SOS response regulatory protein OraA/RecX
VSDTPKAPLDIAVGALRGHDRSRSEVEARLAKAGVAPDDVRETLATLERLGYLDDERFAVARAEELAQRGYGDEWIRRDLRGHGVERETAAAAVEALTTEPERAARLAAGSGGAPDRRFAARLQRKGFSAESIEAVLGAAFADVDERA